MTLVTGDLVALVNQLPSDGRRTRTLMVLRANADGSHDVVDLAWSGLGGGGLVLRLLPVTLHPATPHPEGTATIACALASEAKLSSEELVDYGQRKLEFKSGVHTENARPTAVAFIESLSGRSIPPGPPNPEPDLVAENTMCQWRKGDRLAWIAVRGGGNDRHFFASADPITVLAISYSEEGGMRESGFSLVSESVNLAASFEEMSGKLRTTPMLRR